MARASEASSGGFSTQGWPVAATAAAAKEPPRISTDSEWNALASGSLYYDPRGNLRRKS